MNENSHPVGNSGTCTFLNSENVALKESYKVGVVSFTFLYPQSHNHEFQLVKMVVHFSNTTVNC